MLPGAANWNKSQKLKDVDDSYCKNATEMAEQPRANGQVKTRERALPYKGTDHPRLWIRFRNSGGATRGERSGQNQRTSSPLQGYRSSKAVGKISFHRGGETTRVERSGQNQRASSPLQGNRLAKVVKQTIQRQISRLQTHSQLDNHLS